MPRVIAHVKRLGENLDNANTRINELESEATRYRLEISSLKQGPQEDLKDVLEKLNGLTAAVTFHLNANTLAINALSANIANLNAKVQ